MSIGLYGSGMHDFILDEAELGFRVAACLDDERVWGAEAEYFFLTMTEEDFGPPLDDDWPV